MSKQTKITKSARGQDCQVRVPSICNFNPETTVYAHLNGGGIGMKASEIHGAYACSSCHDAIDGRIKTIYSGDELKLLHLDGVIRTQQILLIEGLIST